MAAQLKLGYWNMRGFAEPIRSLLRYVDVPFEEIRYPFKDGEGQFPSRDVWLKEKFSLDLSFPNLPYLIEGDFKMTQSVAILKHLARKYGLILENGNPQDLANQDMIEAQILDLRNRLIIAFYHKTFPTEADFQIELQTIRDEFTFALGQFEAWLGAKQWLASNSKLTYIDFLAYEYFDWYRVLVKVSFKQFPKMAAFMERFEALPTLKEYLASEQFKKAHILSPYAKLGYNF